MPSWAGAAIAVTFVYALVNFALLLRNTEGGSATEEGGRYFLRNHGRLIRELTPEEYRWQQLFVLRGFSGHWMLFLLVAAVYLRNEPSRPDQITGDGAQELETGSS